MSEDEALNEFSIIDVDDTIHADSVGSDMIAVTSSTDDDIHVTEHTINEETGETA